MTARSQTQPLDVAPPRLANALRFLAADAVERAKSGHPGASLGMAEIAEVQWRRHLKHNPANPQWPDRDRFVLSNDHGSTRDYRDSVLPPSSRCASLEGGVTSFCREYVGRDGLAFGIDRFGESAPAVDLYAHFGLTAANVAAALRSSLTAKDPSWP